MKRNLVLTALVLLLGVAALANEPAGDAGKTHRRRFTDVWRLENGRWLFIARQASIICP